MTDLMPAQDFLPEALRDLPVILVARGCLAPYFLSWWQQSGQTLFVLDFSRWRFFAYEAMPEWVGEAPPKGPVLLFDRNTTTGQTLRLLRRWLIQEGYQPVVVGHLDLALGRLGLLQLDWVWDDAESFDRRGVHTAASCPVLLTPVAAFQRRVEGAYTFCWVGGPPPEPLAGGIHACYSQVTLRTPALTLPGSLQVCAPSWKEAMLLGYLNGRPLVLLSRARATPADYYSDDSDLICLDAFLEPSLRGERGGLCAPTV